MTNTTPKRYRVTRDVGKDEKNNWHGADVAAGTLFYRFRGVAYGSCDEVNGVALTEDPDGGFPFFEFPRNAVQEEV